MAGESLQRILSGEPLPLYPEDITPGMADYLRELHDYLRRLTAKFSPNNIYQSIFDLRADVMPLAFDHNGLIATYPSTTTMFFEGAASYWSYPLPAGKLVGGSICSGGTITVPDPLGVNCSIYKTNLEDIDDGVFTTLNDTSLDLDILSTDDYAEIQTDWDYDLVEGDSLQLKLQATTAVTGWVQVGLFYRPD